MIEVLSHQLKATVESQYGGKARLIQVVPVKETFEGQRVWEGVVSIIDLVGNPKATCAYTWSSPTERNEKRRFFAVLHMGPIDSPLAAVRAAIGA
jgi:hypothetical protein